YAQSAGCAVIAAMYGASGENNHIFHWSVRHKTNPRKNILCENKINELTVYGRLLKLLAPMQGKVAEVTPGYENYSNGAGAFGVSDGENLYVLLWNYNYVDYSKDSEQVELTIKGIPFGQDNIRINTEDLDGKMQTKVICPADSLKKTFEMQRNSVMLIKLVRDNIKRLSQPNTTLIEKCSASVRNRIEKGNVICFSQIRDVNKIIFLQNISQQVILERSFDGYFWEDIYIGEAINGELVLDCPIKARYLREKSGIAVRKIYSSELQWLLGCDERQSQYKIKGNKLLKPAILNGSRACLIMSIGEHDGAFTICTEIGKETADGALLKVSLYDEVNGWREYTSAEVGKETSNLSFMVYNSLVKYIKLEAQGEVQINTFNLLN
ncbi:MAG: hypothetical protein IJD80_00740, partial [Oscillospiraceae bacterium]|nr:hypothetical protein [Oscillospiraceae bacterium]